MNVAQMRELERVSGKPVHESSPIERAPVVGFTMPGRTVSHTQLSYFCTGRQAQHAECKAEWCKCNCHLSTGYPGGEGYDWGIG